MDIETEVNSPVPGRWVRVERVTEPLHPVFTYIYSYHKLSRVLPGRPTSGGFLCDGQRGGSELARALDENFNRDEVGAGQRHPEPARAINPQEHE